MLTTPKGPPFGVSYQAKELEPFGFTTPFKLAELCVILLAYAETITGAPTACTCPAKAKNPKTIDNPINFFMKFFIIFGLFGLLTIFVIIIEKISLWA